MDIETRLGRLERENRRMRAVIAICALGALLFPTMALIPRNRVQDVIQAHRFELRDADGRLAAVLRLADTSEVNPFGAALGRTGKSTPGATLAIFGEGDDEAVSLLGGRDRATLRLSDGNSKRRSTRRNGVSS